MAAIAGAVFSWGMISHEHAVFSPFPGPGQVMAADGGTGNEPVAIGCLLMMAKSAFYGFVRRMIESYKQ